MADLANDTSGHEMDEQTNLNDRHRILGLDRLQHIDVSGQPSEGSTGDTAIAMPQDREAIDWLVSIIPTIPRSIDKMEILQEWEGVVTAVEKDTFTAELVDLTHDRQSHEEADLPIDDLSSDDRQLVEVGSVFRWMIGYQIKPHGSRSRVSRIVFRRLPVWTEEEIENSKKEASDLAKSISWD